MDFRSRQRPDSIEVLQLRYLIRLIELKSVIQGMDVIRAGLWTQTIKGKKMAKT
jgi:hypothetical protein